MKFSLIFLSLLATVLAHGVHSMSDSSDGSLSDDLSDSDNSEGGIDYTEGMYDNAVSQLMLMSFLTSPS